METTAKQSIHVAGVIDLAEAQLLVDCGISHIGFPLVLDHHKEDLTIADAAAVVAKLNERATFFLITYLNDAQAIIDLCRELAVEIIQLHGQISPDQIQRLRETAPNLKIIKSLIVRGNNTNALIDEVQRFSPSVDSFITDTFDPKTGASGATGRVHDWEISRTLAKVSRKPVILAGGLTATNVREAIHAVRPAGVDVHTGVEGPDGRQQRDLVMRFAEAAHAGFRNIESL